MSEKETTLDRSFLQTQVVESSYDVRDYRIVAGTDFPETFELPKRVNVKNQGTKPTCVAHALSSLIEYHKSASSRLLKKEFPQIRQKLWKEYFWSQSFCPLTTGGAPIEVIKKYIESQGQKERKRK